MLWSDARIVRLMNERCMDWHSTVKLFAVAEYLEAMRDEYEAKIAALRSEIDAKDAYIDDLEKDA